MFKRLMIVFVALGLVAVFLAEAASAATVRKRRSVGVTLFSDSSGTFVTSVFGLPGENDDCGEVVGELYCASNATEAARLACDIATGDSAARVLVLDKEAIRDGVPPNFFTKEEVNFFLKDRGQREQLLGFETRALSNDSNVFVISLPTGNKNNAGFHALTDLRKWNDGGNLSDNDALRRFVGRWDADEGKFIPDDGFGINGEEFIHKVPGVVPLWGPDLDDLVGKTVCAAVKHPQVKGNPLKGEYLGLAAFKVLSRSESLVNVEVLDADDVCGLPLYIDNGTWGAAEAEQCLVANAGVVPEAFVFAPAFPDGGLRAGEGKFPAVQGTLIWDGVRWKQTVEVILDDNVGQTLCKQTYPNNPDVTFVDFIPVNRGGYGDYASYAFIGLTESDNPDIADKVICSEGVEGGSRFDCKEFDGAIPECFDACSSKFPGFLTPSGTYADFLDTIGIGAINCEPVPFYAFDDEVWDFRPIGTEAGHTLWAIRENEEDTILFDSDDCSSMGIARRVDFDKENLVFNDTSDDDSMANIYLDPYQMSLDVYRNFLPIPGSDLDGKVDVYMCEYILDYPVVLDYLRDPITVKAGHYFFFFNDYHPSSDYDDFILLGEPVFNP